MRVLQVVDSLGIGGAERHVARLALASRGSAIEMAVVALREQPGSPLVEQLREAGIPFEVIPLTACDGQRAGARPAPRELLRLLSLVRRGRFDLVHTHLNTADVVGGLAGLVNRTAVVSTQHSVRRAAPNAAREGVRRALLRHGARAVIAVGEAVGDVQRSELGSEHVTVIPNPAPELAPPDPERRAAMRDALGLSADQPVLLALGRLEAAKDHELMLDALRLVVDRRPGTVLLVAGIGSRERAIRDRIEQLSLDTSVRLLGQRRDVDDLVVAADLLVSSSAYEGMPMSILEAMAAGLPVVATDVGDCRAVIGEGGRVVPAGDPAALAAAIEEVLDPRVRAMCSVEARWRAGTEFGPENWFRRVTEVYRRAAAGPA